jgi:hypothetical protein
MKRLLIAIFICLPVVFPRPASGQASNPSNTQWLVDTAQQVLKQGAEVGLDAAGTKFLGPNAWKVFKLVLQPVVDKLEQRYPTLSFEKPKNNAAIAAANQAADYLAHNADLQRLLVEKFDNLEESQQEIIEGQRQIKSTLEQIQKAVSPPELPHEIDLLDYYEQVRKEFPPGGHSSRLVLMAMQEACESKVAEKGETFTVYNCKYGDVVLTAHSTSDKYSDENGDLCRQMVTDFFQGSQVGDSGQSVENRCRRTVEICQTAGTWREKNILKCDQSDRNCPRGCKGPG